jgi:hypothetical protein
LFWYTALQRLKISGQRDTVLQVKCGTTISNSRKMWSQKTSIGIWQTE